MVVLMWLPNLLVAAGAAWAYRVSERGIAAPPRILAAVGGRR
jgi:hypothetical protein